MPTYVYGCDACGHRFEKSQKFSDDPIRVCPQCQSSVRRIFQPAGIVFKGSGWHVNDYKRGGGKSSDVAKDGDSGAASNGTAKPETSSTEAASTPAAPAAKSETAKSSAGDASAPAKTAS